QKAVNGGAGSPRWLIAASEISLPADFFWGEFKKQSGGLFFEEGRFFAKKRALPLPLSRLSLAAFRRQQAFLTS
ncbi:MAG: hypothetical protein IJ049_02835, partial [Oscillospiraceae bacterium]|nr:hypothetical protein [Oscillospiraceae bacterium]